MNLTIRYAEARTKGEGRGDPGGPGGPGGLGGPRGPGGPGGPGADMKFVQNFTPPDFQVKNFTPSISPNFNSFSKKKHKK